MGEPSELVTSLRNMLADDDGNKNILNGKQEQYSDTKLQFFLDMAIRDINATSPITNYTIDTCPDQNLIVFGGMVFCLIAEGILQIRNQLDYNDAGLSISMFNKSGGYQTWASFILQSYLMAKDQFKRSVIPSSSGAGFLGIRSQFSPYWGEY